MRAFLQHPRLLHLVGALAVGALALAAPSAARAQDRHRIDTTVAVGRDASVDLGLINGDITVTASSRGDVRIDATSEVIPLRFEHVGNTVRVTTVSGSYRRSGEQRMEVVVPFGTRVNASTVSGRVSVRGVRGEVEANSVSGGVIVEDATRRVRISAVSGGVRGRNIDGNVWARAVSGGVVLERITGEVDAETVSGGVSVRDARSERVHQQSVSGELLYDGTITRDGRYDFQSHSGNVRLLLGDGAAISLSAQTFSGAIDSRFEMTMGPSRAGTRRGQRMDFTVNGGGARVTAQTFSGNIVLDRASRRPD